MDSIAEEGLVDDKKRFAAHSVNEKGKEFSLAEECARLLRIGRSDEISRKISEERKRPGNKAPRMVGLVEKRQSIGIEILYR